MLACLSIYVLAALIVNMAFDLPHEIQSILHLADTSLCLVFLADFLRRLLTAPSKMEYLKWGWIDLLASIPSVDALRWGRVVSVTRLLMVLRAVRSGRALLRVLRHDPGRAVIAATLLTTTLLMITCSILILTVETAEKSNIKNGYDALWWSLTTITTVGYGDHFPVTAKGRLVGALLMGAGITLFATFTAFISAKIMNMHQKHERDEVDAIYDEVKNLRIEMRELREAINAQQVSRSTPPTDDKIG
ncbi:MAG: ion transporter [Prosthecobacter sp.]